MVPKLFKVTIIATSCNVEDANRLHKIFTKYISATKHASHNGF